ncbi:hypothetical protein ACFQZT_26865 [Paenibacillus sp. GCM10027628]|uniref:hypothetical protein n=1 Tax=Paenibacillus sp. GCM10027628 TaxID=3273413 RepID=UPI0036342D95
MHQTYSTISIKQKSIGFLFLILGILIFLIKFLSDSADNVGESPTLFYIGGNGEVRGHDVLVDKVIPLEETKIVKPGEQVQFNGKFNVNTSGLSEEEIRKMIPIIEAYRVVFNRHEEIIFPVKK